MKIVEQIPCQCGCGQLIPSRDDHNRPRRFVPGHHNLKPKKYRLCLCGCGHMVTEPKRYLRNHQNTTIGFKKGYSPWNKGVSYMPKNINQLIKIGTEKLKSLDRTGAKNNNWKGGITLAHNKLRTTGAMVAWRKSVFKRDNYTCVKCSKRGGSLVADHHPYAFHKYPEQRLVLANGRTLCEQCNYESTYILKEWNQ